jgi:acyl-CoA synthetase (NDP forming)
VTSAGSGAPPDPGRPRADIERFLHPRTVAVIGVSENPTAPGVSMFRKIRDKVEAQGGRVFPVNPKASELYGLRCYPTITAIPGEIDLGVIQVSDAVAALRQCVEKRCRFVVVFTAGFAETGPEGAAREAELVRIAREGGVRLFGPNTNLNAFEVLPDAPGGKIALLTQSGNQGRPIVHGGQELGLGFSYWIPTGNESDLELADFLEYFASHEDTAVIAAYVEGFKDPERLRRAADACARARKPIVLVKVGRSDAGQRMAQAHTGHLAGSDRVVDALFRQYGIVRVEDLDELLETAALFARLPRPSGDRVCVYGVSGGTGALMSDLLGAYGVALPELAPATQARLRELLPSYLTVRNPVDNGAAVLRSGKGAAILDAIADDPGVDLVLTPLAGALPGMTEVLAEDLARLHVSGRKPCVAAWASNRTDDPAFRALIGARMPLFRSFRGAARALRAFFAYHAFAERYVSPLAAPRPARAAVTSIGGRPGRTGALGEADSKRLLAAYGLPVTREEVAGTEEEARAAAERIGYPVALKIASPDIVHKSDAGLVRLGLATGEAVATAQREVLALARRAHPEARLDGVLVQEMVPPGVEAILGVSVDPQLGPVVLVGLGGVLVELLGDVAMRPLPLTEHDARAMVDELRGRAILDGVRGGSPRDVDALVGAILAVARLAGDHRDRLLELDVNPLVVHERGQGVRAVDALVVLRGDGVGG